MRGNTTVLVVALLPWLNVARSKSTAAPHATFDAGSSHLLEATRVRAEIERGQQQGQQQQQQQQQGNAVPPKLYRNLSGWSAGRYVLAASSLAGECARIYAPAPLGSFASSLYNCFNGSLFSQRRDPPASVGQKKPPGRSYDRFMSHDDPTGDEDVPGDGDLCDFAVLPDKYSRVSSPFLARHEIGLDNTGRYSSDHENSSSVRSPEVVRKERRGNERNKDAAVGFNRPAKARVVFQSLAKLGRDRRDVGDDLDLLSDPEERRETSEWEEREKKGITDGWASEDMISGATGPKTTSDEAAVRCNRNLVDRDADELSSLVKKMRLAENSKGVSRNQRKNRQSKSRSRKEK